MKSIRWQLLLLCAALPALTAHAADKKNVTIPFVNHGNIETFQAVDHKALLIADRHRHWYKATFFGPCTPLDASTWAVGFVTSPGGTVDKFSAIIVDGQRCWFKDLQEVPAPGKVTG